MRRASYHFKRLRNLAVSLVFLTAAFGSANSAAPSSAISEKMNARKYLGTARWFTDKGYYNMAEEQYKLALDLDPNHYLAHKELGELYFRLLHDIPAAVKHFELAIKNMGNEKAGQSELHFLLGESYHFVGRYREAISSYQQVDQYINENESGKELRESIIHSIKQCKLALELESTTKWMDVRLNNLGGTINSKYDDYGAVFDKSGDFMLYTSRRRNSTGGIVDAKDEKYDEGMYISPISNKNFGEPQKFDASYRLVKNLMNTDKHEAVVCMAPDGSTLITYRDRALWESKRVEGVWKHPVKLPEAINGGKQQTHASLTADGNSMYFTSNRSGGRGGSDIYLVTKRLDGSWGEPQNLGPKVNTPMAEDSPEISPDGKTLYFSSTGHRGMGGYDVYKSEFIDGAWQQAKNLGIPINSAADELYFRMEKDEMHGYLSSSRRGGYGQMDIYEVDFTPFPYFEECRSMTEQFKTYEARLNATRYAKDPNPAMIYQWDTGDGGYAEGVFVTHIYKRPGSYTAKLNEYDPVTETTRFIADNIRVEVTGPDHFEFTTADTVGVGDEVYFDGTFSVVQNGALSNYFWNFDDDTEFLNQKSAYHIYGSAGTKMVSLELDVKMADGTRDRRCISKPITVLNASDYYRYMKRKESQHAKRAQEITLLEGRITKEADWDSLSAYEARIELEPIYFDYNSAEIREDAMRSLERNAEKLRSLHNIIIKVQAHTDSRGSVDYNFRLSKKRAKAAVNFLVENGIPRKRIAAVLSSGETDLVNKCIDDAACTRRQHQMNRRAEFIVVGLAHQL